MINRVRQMPARLCAAIWVAVLPGLGMAGAVEDQIEALTSEIAAPGPATVGGEEILADEFIVEFYQRRGFAPAWFGTAAQDDLITALNGGIQQGFRPEDFDMLQLTLALSSAEQGTPADIARFEVMATEAAARLIGYTIFGKVNPAELDADWNFERPIIKSDPVEVVSDYLAGEGFGALMDRLAIDNPQYQQLVEALARYRAIAAQGGWPEVPSEDVIKPDAVSPAVAVLRDRLAAEGLLNKGQNLPQTTQPDVNPREVYDAALQEDMRLFQERHGLEADGVIGGRTFRALNRSAEHRVEQLRLSLERGRWLMRNLEGDFVLVNIAGARTYLARADGTIWTTRSITGSQYRKTPVFRDEIKYMEFNPTWTVPNSIFRKDKLARIRKDSGYLSRNNYVVRNKNGKTISAGSVNWSSSNPPVTLVQQPGPSNALGLVKFMFPNAYAVYLHDTNDGSLFGRNERNLSSGCVRLEYPFELAMLLMEGDPEWSYERMQAILDSKKTTRVDLPAPVPVLLTYWTAWVEEDVIQFREDIYERDAPILAALNG